MAEGANTKTSRKRLKPWTTPELVVSIISWLAVAAWIAFIIYMSSRSSESLENANDEIGFLSVIIHGIFDSIFGKDIGMGDIVAHVGEYIILGALVANALRFHVSLKKAFWISFLFCILFGLGDEIHQLLADQGRAFQVLDLCCDTFGSFIGSFVLTRFKRLARY